MNEYLKQVRGTFDGEKMLGDDGRSYAVNANYASKSKIIDGDRLELFIQADGEYRYKQLEIVPRLRFLGRVVVTPTRVMIEDPNTNKLYRVLESTVRYFHLSANSPVAALTSATATWAAVENVLDKAMLDVSQDRELEA